MSAKSVVSWWSASWVAFLEDSIEELSTGMWNNIPGAMTDQRDLKRVGQRRISVVTDLYSR